ncbi:MAG: hypothetical protein IPM70_10635 [Proteobacteria bacterium]|nr:hypothetical protein [Pseudomonadota bacterium]
MMGICRSGRFILARLFDTSPLVAMRVALADGGDGHTQFSSALGARAHHNRAAPGSRWCPTFEKPRHGAQFALDLGRRCGERVSDRRQ